MRYIKKQSINLLIADDGKLLRAKDDIYKPATGDEPEYLPYRTDVIFPAEGLTEQEVMDMYVEEDI